MSLPHAIPSVDFPIVQIVLYASVKHKVPLVCAIFLAKGGNRLLRNCSNYQVCRRHRLIFSYVFKKKKVR